MKIKNKVKISSCYYNNNEIKELFLQRKINLRDYSDIEGIEARDGKTYLNGDLIDFYYLCILRDVQSAYFYAKDDNNLVLCAVFCGFDKFIPVEDIRVFEFDFFDDNHKFKCLL